mmetsp:Transcript_41796/g.90681  ORF Transcript_41796/g.90681 Transcript_41796/m.90681 type:complete len:113 (+) Transcript_41796:318-656(+)
MRWKRWTDSRVADLHFDDEVFLSRCAGCNAPGYTRITGDDAQKRLGEAHLPNHVKEKVGDEFYICSGCEKIFWKGPKYDAARELLIGLLQEARGTDPSPNVSATESVASTRG